MKASSTVAEAMPTRLAPTRRHANGGADLAISTPSRSRRRHQQPDQDVGPQDDDLEAHHRTVSVGRPACEISVRIRPTMYRAPSR